MIIAAIKNFHSLLETSGPFYITDYSLLSLHLKLWTIVNTVKLNILLCLFKLAYYY